MELDELKRNIYKDGHITPSEIDLIEEFLQSDGGMNKTKGNFLFDLKNNYTKDKLPPKFKSIFINSITSYLLDDEDSPGEIDEDEAKWLRAKIQYNGKIDEYDKALLENLKKKSINFPQVLQYKSLRARIFENWLYGSRYLSLLAAIGSIISAIFLFAEGIYIIYFGLSHHFFTNQIKDGKIDYEPIFESLVSSVDVFLFALVLIIFGVGVYELFVSKIDPIERDNDNRPSWLKINSVDDLKGSLGKVILMVLIVSFFKHILELKDSEWGALTLLYLSIGIFLIAAALYLTHKSHERHEKQEKTENNESQQSVTESLS